MYVLRSLFDLFNMAFLANATLWPGYMRFLSEYNTPLTAICPYPPTRSFLVYYIVIASSTFELTGVKYLRQ